MAKLDQKFTKNARSKFRSVNDGESSDFEQEDRRKKRRVIRKRADEELGCYDF